MKMKEKFERLLNRLIERAEQTNDVNELIALSEAAIKVASMMEVITMSGEDVISEFYDIISALWLEAKDHECAVINTVGSASELCEQAGRIVQMLRNANELIWKHYDHVARDMNTPVPGTARELPTLYTAAPNRQRKPRIRRNALAKLVARLEAQLEQSMWAQLEQSIWEEASDTEAEDSEDDA